MVTKITFILAIFSWIYLNIDLFNRKYGDAGGFVVS